MEIFSERFPQAARAALADPALQRAVKSATEGLLAKRRRAVEEIPDWENLRELARAIKAHTLANLSTYLDAFSENARRRNARVFFARDAAAANGYVAELARSSGVALAVKSKSMVTEELGLNGALQRAGVEVVETDLGEYIIQLAGDRPSHIVAPVIHKTREDIARLFAEKLGSDPDASIEDLTRTARRVLREKFLRAQMGISGGNFAVAETGSLVIVENEGNARLTTSLPRIHVAVVGMEKLVPRMADLYVFLQLLARSATGQKMTSYVSILAGPRRAGEPDGPQEVHIVILDNGRSSIAADAEMRESLHCIRCGACLNVCPVYRLAGGHAYGSVYPGPIGSVFTPLVAGLSRASPLPFASSLCGACESICPVKIPIPAMLLRLRQRFAQSEHVPPMETAALAIWKFFMLGPQRYALGGRLLRWLRPLAARRRGGSGWLSGWTRFRELPLPAEETFHQQWKRSRGWEKSGEAMSIGKPEDRLEKEAAAAGRGSSLPLPILELTARRAGPAGLERFVREAAAAGARVYRCRQDQVRAALLEALRKEPEDAAILFESGELLRFACRRADTHRQAGWEIEAQQMCGCLMGDLRTSGPLAAREFDVAAVAVGVTGADFALADTGTVVLQASRQRGRLLSLLPPVHLVIVEAARVLPDLGSLLAHPLEESSAITFITGPSKTADIEQNLAVGVHGPAELHIVLVEVWEERAR